MASHGTYWEQIRGGPLAPLNMGGFSPSWWEGPSFLFRVRGKGPNSEAQWTAGPSPPATGFVVETRRELAGKTAMSGTKLPQ